MRDYYNNRYKRKRFYDFWNPSKKIDNIRNEIKKARDMMDRVEERMIYGWLSESKGDRMLFDLSEDLSEKERRMLELANESIGKSQ